MKSLRVALLASSMLAAVFVQAQTVDEIISKHVEAIGGKDVVNAAKSLYVEYDMDAMGNQAAGSFSIIDGKGYRNDMDFGGQKIVEVSTPTGGWSLNPMMGQASPTAMPAEQAKFGKFRIWVSGPLNDYAARGYKAELLGKENVGSVSAHKIKLTTSEGAAMTFFIDPTSYHIIKAISTVDFNGQSAEITYAYSNFEKSASGLIMPKSTEISFPGFTVTLTNKKTEVNKEIDARVFDMQ